MKARDANSNIEEYDAGLRFKRIIAENYKGQQADDKIKRVVLCSGQVYYDIEAARQKENKSDVVIIRVEQLCPFPFRAIMVELEKYNNADLVWAQEEHKNAGAWSWAQPRLNNILKHHGKVPDVKYVGREPSASSASGYYKVHETELKTFLKDVLAY